MQRRLMCSNEQLEKAVGAIKINHASTLQSVLADPSCPHEHRQRLILHPAYIGIIDFCYERFIHKHCNNKDYMYVLWECWNTDQFNDLLYGNRYLGTDLIF